MRLSTYLKIYPCHETPGYLLLYSTRRASAVRITQRALQRIHEGTLSESEQATLARLGILVADPEAEREEILNRFTEANRLTRRFNATVVMNLDCNLACPYCFEEGVRGQRYMSSEIADLLVEMIERDQLSQGREVNIDFYGGEPLLSRDLIKSIAGRIGKSAAEKGIAFSFFLVTNGTLLTRSLAEELKALGLKGAKVTLDGPREIHDLSRPFASGKGSSFDAIVRNIQEVWDLIDLQVGGNYTYENYRDFPRLFDYLVSVGITPEKVQLVHLGPVTGRIAAPGIPDYQGGCDCADEPWLYEATLYLREEVMKRGYPVPKPRPKGCMVELDFELVVNIDGALYRCPGFVGHEEFAVGDVRRGIVTDGAIYNPDVWKKQECLECAYLPQCFGGCRFLKFLREGKIDDVDCWRAFLDATLEGCLRQDLARPSTPPSPAA